MTRNWLVSALRSSCWVLAAVDGVLVCTHFDRGVGWAQWTAGGRGGHTRELLNVDSDTVINNINIQY